VLPRAIGAVVEGVPATAHTPLSGHVSPVRAVVPIGHLVCITQTLSVALLVQCVRGVTTSNSGRTAIPPLASGLTGVPTYLPARFVSCLFLLHNQPKAYKSNSHRLRIYVEPFDERDGDSQVVN